MIILSKKGFSLIELLVALSVLLVLMSILIAGLRGAREKAVLAQCTSNLRQFHSAIFLYANEHRGELPPGHRSDDRAGNTWNNVWWYALWPYMGWDSGIEKNGINWLRFAKEFGCPVIPADDRDHLNYAISGYLTSDNYNIATLENPARNMLMTTLWGRSRVVPADVSHPSWEPPPGPSVSWNFWYNRRTNVLFLDGSVRLVGYDNLLAIQGDINDPFWGLSPNGYSNLRMNSN